MSIIVTFQNLGNQGEDSKSFERKKKLEIAFLNTLGVRKQCFQMLKEKSVFHLRVLHPDQLSVECK